MATDSSISDINQVLLRGRFAGEAIDRTLPSGDELVAFRVTVNRPPGGRVRVDSIDCSSTKAAVRRSVARCEPGDSIELTGRLQRRFWRSVAGTPASRYEVEVSSLKRSKSAQ